MTQVFCRKCGDLYPAARFRLGYDTCLPCGDLVAHQVQWLSAPINKSNYMLISNLDDLKGLNPKRIGE